MENKDAIHALAALSHERRMNVFYLLANAGKNGVNAGSIAEQLDVPASSLSFHLTHLERSKLISSRRKNRQIIYSINTDTFAELISDLVKNVYKNDPDILSKVTARLTG